MNIRTSFALLSGGVLFISHGLSAPNSIGAGFIRMFAGEATERSLWLLISGVIAAMTAVPFTHITHPSKKLSLCRV